MPKTVLRIVTLTLVPWLALRSAIPVCLSDSPCRRHGPAPVWAEQALCERAVSREMIGHKQEIEIDQGAAKFSRRSFFAASAAAIAIAVTADAQPADERPIWLQPSFGTSRDPRREFSNIGVAPPAHVQALIDSFEKRQNGVRELLYTMGRDTFQLKAGSMREHWQIVDRSYFDLGHFMADAILRDLQMYGGLPQDRIRAIENRLTRRGDDSGDFRFLYFELIPEYFQAHGLYFVYQTAIFNNLQIPHFVLRQV